MRMWRVILSSKRDKIFASKVNSFSEINALVLYVYIYIIIIIIIILIIYKYS